MPLKDGEKVVYIGEYAQDPRYQGGVSATFMYVNGELPDAEPGAAFMLKVRTNENLADVNQEIARLAMCYSYEFIPASNEPSSRACTDIGECREGQNTNALKRIQLCCASSLIPRQLAAGSLIDVNQGLTDENGNLKAEYTIEGVYMYSDAYCVVFDNLKKYLCALAGNGESYEKTSV